MLIDSLTAPPTAGPVATGAPPGGSGGAPPGFSDALADASTTWTATAEGQTASQTPQDDTAAAVVDEPAVAEGEQLPAAASEPTATDPATALTAELAAALAAPAPAATPAPGPVTVGGPAASAGTSAAVAAVASHADLAGDDPALPGGAPIAGATPQPVGDGTQPQPQPQPDTSAAATVLPTMPAPGGAPVQAGAPNATPATPMASPADAGSPAAPTTPPAATSAPTGAPGAQPAATAGTPDEVLAALAQAASPPAPAAPATAPSAVPGAVIGAEPAAVTSDGSMAGGDAGADGESAQGAPSGGQAVPASPAAGASAATPPVAAPAAASSEGAAPPAATPAGAESRTIGAVSGDAPPPAAAPPASAPAPSSTAPQSTAPAPPPVPAFAGPTVEAATAGARSSAIEALVHLGSHRGQAAARIALAPETLGGIQVTLTFGADGVTARLLAERPEAAAALTRASHDLRDSLQRQGIELASLETGFAGGGMTGHDQGQRAAWSSGPSRTSRPVSLADFEDEAVLAVSVTEAPAQHLNGSGRLVDLRA